MLRIFIVALLMTIGLPLAAQAEHQSTHVPQENRSGEHADFNQLLERLRQHPQITSYQSKVESLQNYSEGALGLPDPMLFIQEQDYPIGPTSSRDDEQKMIGFKQTIPAFGTRSAKSGRTAAEAEKEKLAGEYAYAAMKAKLISALATLQSIREQEKLLDAQANLFASEKTSIKGRIAANQTGVSQLSMSQAENTQLQIMRAELSEQRHEIEAMLVSMIGDAPNVDLPNIEMTAWDRNPDQTYPVRIAAGDIAMARREVDVREAEFGPSLELQGGYSRMNNGDNASTIMIGVSIPLWASESQRPNLAGAKASLRSSEMGREAAQREVIAKLDHLKAQIDISTQKIKLLETKNAHLQDSAQAITREYEAGKADLAMYLKARREALSASISTAQEHAKQTSLIADFNRYIIKGENHE